MVEKQDQENIPDIEKQGWEAEKLAEEAANMEDDEIVKEMRRIEESDSDPENENDSSN